MAYPSDIIMRGTVAARPLASIAGRLYFVTDTNTLTRDNGAGWDSVEAGPGAIPDATVAAPGVVEIDAAPATGHPIAVTTPRIGAASGVASLDAGAKLPLAQLPAHEATHLAGGADPIDWAGHIHLAGTHAARPAAAAANTGSLYFETDTTDLFRSDGAAWTQIAKGVSDPTAWASLTGIPGTFTPSVHASTHLPGGSDAIDFVGTVHRAGTHAARPAAGASNAGTLYFETDTSTLFRSDGATWTQIAFSLAVENAHLFLAGPASGAAAVPAFRALVDGDLPYAVATKTASYAMVATDQAILVAAAGLTVTLPAASGVTAGKPYRIKNTNNGESTIVIAAAGNIDNVPTYTGLASPLSAAAFVSDGTNWWIV